ncbi:IgGFc-binding protein [Flavobacteriaceae bacterium]|nr:IgGFc-binding protein [Flavobacteriaceae bacterium]
MMRRLFFAIFFLIIHVSLFAQLSKVHYLPPIAYSSETGSNAIPNQGHYFYISTPSTSSVTVNVYAVGGATTTVEVSNANPYVFTIDDPGGFNDSQIAIGASSSDTATTTSIISTNKGYIVEADSSIYVALRIASDSQAGALVSKGGAALGTDFRIGAFTNYNGQASYSSFLSVMATENATTITINNILEGVDILDFNEQTLGTDGVGYLNSITFTLNRGESYTIVTRSDQGTDVLSELEAASTQKTNSDGLIGTYVGSTKPIVVNSGSLNGSFGLGGARDYGFDQLVDYSKVGTEYIFVKGTGNDEWENVLLVAHTDNTEITINGNPISNAFIHGKGVNISSAYDSTIGNPSINAGDYFLIEGDLYGSDGNMYVQSSSPLFAFQGIGSGGGEANQGLFFVPPLKCSSVGDVDNIPMINEIGNGVFTGNLNIISKRGAIITISDDNNTDQAIEALNIANLSGPFDVLGNVDYQTYVLSNLNGDVSIVSNDELYCSYFNQSGAASSGAFYSGFSSPPEIPTKIIGLELYDYCAPNLTLATTNMDIFTSYEWQYSDGTGYTTIDESTNQSTITPTLGGLYIIRGFISCPGETEEFLDSDPVTVELCPPDTDLDGILDPSDSCPFAAGIEFLNGCPWSVYIGNNYKSTLVYSTVEITDESYFCGQTNDNHFNLAYHSGEFPEPVVGDFIIHNNGYFFPHSFLLETEGYAYMKLRDFNKIIEVQKTNGEIIAIYSCL